MPNSKRRERILIVRLAALGDVARATALLGRIRRERPAAHVTWIAATGSIPLLELVPGIDRLVGVDEAKVFRGSSRARLVQALSLWVRLIAMRFDLALLAHPDPRYGRLLAGLRIKHTHVLRAATAQSNDYIGDEFASLLDEKPIAPGAYPLADLRQTISAIPFPAAAANENSHSRVLLVPGGARNILRDDPLRRWPLESYALLARQLSADGLDVVIIGASSDGWVRGAFDGIPVRDLIGKLDLPQTLRLMAEPDTVVVSHDTGPLHLAQLVRARTVALFGPTVPARVLGHSENVTTIWGGKDLPCRPCYDGTSYAVCNRNRCMESIGVSVVASAVSAAAAGASPHREVAV